MPLDTITLGAVPFKTPLPVANGIQVRTIHYHPNYCASWSEERFPHPPCFSPAFSHTRAAWEVIENKLYVIDLDSRNHMHNIWICDMNKEFVQQNFIHCGTMTAPRDSPATLALKEKIYVLGGLYLYPYPGEPASPMTPFAEVFNTFTNSCMPLPDPEVWDVKGLDKDLNGFFWAALDDTDEIVCGTAHAEGILLYSLKVGDGVRSKKWKMYTIPPPLHLHRSSVLEEEKLWSLTAILSGLVLSMGEG